jgi:hypothetical protein
VVIICTSIIFIQKRCDREIDMEPVGGDHHGRRNKGPLISLVLVALHLEVHSFVVDMFCSQITLEHSNH